MKKTTEPPVVRARLQPGECTAFPWMEDPVIELTASPEWGYVWIGNGPKARGQWCFATVSVAKLVPMAHEILRQAALLKKRRKAA